MDELTKLLDVVRSSLSAVDARAEVGGRDPEDPHLVWTPLAPGWRIVAVFETPPEDAEEKRKRLEALVRPFEDLGERVEVPSGTLAPVKERTVDEALDALAERAGARAALVFDERSPVLWGSSSLLVKGWDVDWMERTAALTGEIARAGLDPAAWLAGQAPSEQELGAAGIDETIARRWGHRLERLARSGEGWGEEEWRKALRISTAVSAVRAECRGGRAPERVSRVEEGWGVFAREFAQIYACALVYDGTFSELHAEGALVRALPHLETLVLALPPIEPPPRRAQVIRLPR